MDVEMNMEMDIELFITEIQSRPAFWDLRSESYSNWGEKLKAWEEISQLFEIVVSTRNSQTNIMMPISTDLDSYRIVRNKTLRRLTLYRAHVLQMWSGDVGADRAELMPVSSERPPVRPAPLRPL